MAGPGPGWKRALPAEKRVLEREMKHRLGTPLAFYKPPAWLRKPSLRAGWAGSSGSAGAELGSPVARHLGLRQLAAA